MKDRSRQRANRRTKHREEAIERRNAYGIKDMTPYNAVQQIRTGGKAYIELGTPQSCFYGKPIAPDKETPDGGYFIAQNYERGETA